MKHGKVLDGVEGLFKDVSSPPSPLSLTLIKPGYPPLADSADCGPFEGKWEWPILNSYLVN